MRILDKLEEQKKSSPDSSFFQVWPCVFSGHACAGFVRVQIPLPTEVPSVLAAFLGPGGAPLMCLSSLGGGGIGDKYHGFGTKYKGIRYQIQWIRYQIQWIRYQIQWIRYQIQWYEKVQKRTARGDQRTRADMYSHPFPLRPPLAPPGAPRRGPKAIWIPSGRYTDWCR